MHIITERSVYTLRSVIICKFYFFNYLFFRGPKLLYGWLCNNGIIVHIICDWHPNMNNRIWFKTIKSTFLFGECPLIICKLLFKVLKNTLFTLQLLDFWLYSTFIGPPMWISLVLENMRNEIWPCVSLNGNNFVKIWVNFFTPFLYFARVIFTSQTFLVTH